MTGAPAFAMIVVMGRNRVIGRGGDMPWHLSSDLKYFRAVTTGKPVVMGRRTFESIGKPLPGRTNLVVTRDPDFSPHGVLVFRDLALALGEARRIARETGAPEVMIAGGGSVYDSCLPLADRLYVTHVDLEPEGDTLFPEIDPADWTVVSKQPMERGPRDDAAAVFVVYERRRR